MAYPLPGFGRNPFVDDGHDQQASPPPASTVGAPWGSSSSSSSSSKQQMLDASFPADPPSRYPAKLAHGSSQNKRRPQTAQQAAMSHAERIVRDPALWQGFKAMIRERRNDVALPTTNLLAVEYLHQFVEHQFELEAERIAQEEAVYYYEIQRRYESADSSSKSDKEYGDGRITLQKAARWLTGSFSLSLSSVDREEAAALAAAYDTQRVSQQQSSALVMSCRENMSISSSSIESDAPQGSDNEGSSNSNSFSDSLTSFLKEAAHLTAPESPLIPKLQLQRRRAPRDLSTRDEDIIDESEELEVDGRLNVAENHAPRSDEYSSAAQERQEEEHNNRRVHYHSHPRPPLPRPQGPPPSALASSRSSNGRGRRRNGPVLPASRGVPLAGILEYGEQDYEHYSPAGGDPTASTLSRCPVPPPVSLQEQTPSWGPRAA